MASIAANFEGPARCRDESRAPGRLCVTRFRTKLLRVLSLSAALVDRSFRPRPCDSGRVLFFGVFGCGMRSPYPTGTTIRRTGTLRIAPRCRKRQRDGAVISLPTSWTRCCVPALSGYGPSRV